jgi:hypothetical protein
MENESRDGASPEYTLQEKDSFVGALPILEQCKYGSALQHLEFGKTIGDSADTLRGFQIKADSLLDQGRDEWERQTGASTNQHNQAGQISIGVGREDTQTSTSRATQPPNATTARPQSNTSVRRLPPNPSGGR